MAHIEFILAAVTVVLTCAWLISRFVLSRRTSRDLVWRTALIVVAITPGLALVRGEFLPWQFSLPILPAVSTRVLDLRLKYIRRRHLPKIVASRSSGNRNCD